MTTTLDDLERRVEQLSDRVDALEDENERLREENEELRDRVGSVETTRVDLRGRRLEDLWIERPDLDLELPIGQIVTAKVSRRDLQEEVDELRESLEEGEIGTADDVELAVEPETPIEELCLLPPAMQREALTKNQHRAVQFAEQFYSVTNPTSGDSRVVNASDISRWLASNTDATTHQTASNRVHSDTLDSVMRYLGALGDDRVRIAQKKSGGERTVIVETETAERCQQFGAADLDEQIVQSVEMNHDTVTDGAA